MNKILSPAERRALKARAHPLKPTVMIGNDGLSANVLQEIDSTLKAHELIKIRVEVEDSDEREDMLGLICASTNASAIDHIGKILVVYRERPQSERAKANAQAGRNNGQRGGKKPGERGTQAQGQGGAGQNPGGPRTGGKKPGGPVWTKSRQQRSGGKRRSGGGGGPNRGSGGNSSGGQGGGNSGGGEA